MSTQHTQEPWSVSESGIVYASPVDDSNESVFICDPVPDAHDDITDEELANARRIVACVNACAGIDTGTIEASGLFKQHIEALGKNASEGYPGIAHDFEQMRMQRDDLLESCVKAQHWLRGDKWRFGTEQERNSWEAMNREIEAAIAKANGAPCKG